MRKTIDSCDRCGKEGKIESIINWAGYFKFDSAKNYHFNFDLCDKCLKAFKINLKEFMEYESN